MSDRLFALRLFVRVARKGSFSAAGRELNIPQSTASRTIATLEREIGVALFVRTTRAVTLTDAGLDFLARIESVLAELDDAEHAARGTGELRGILRIGLATNFAVREVIPRLSDFMSRHPALRIDLMMGDQREDLVAEGVDVALRFGPLSDSTATVRRILAWPRILAASRAYLDKAGAPLTPTDLAQYAIILGPASLSGHWSFREGDTATSFQVEGKLTIRASLGAIAAAVEGLGIVRIGHRHDSARRVPSGIRERGARSAIAGMGRGNGRAQRRLCQRQSRQAISTSLCRLLDRSASRRPAAVGPTFD